MSVLQKTARIVDVVAASPGPYRLVEVAKAVDLPLSSVHRMVGELIELGMLSRVGDGYILGPRLMAWGAVAQESFDLRTFALTPMRQLRDAVGESVHLYAIDHGHRVCLARVSGIHTLQPYVEIGRQKRLAGGSSGRLLLAFSSQMHQRAVIAQMEHAHDPHVPTLPELARIRAEDWETSYGEREDGVVAGATSIRGPREEVIGAITVSSVAGRVPEERLLDFQAPLRACAADIAAVIRAAHQPA